MHLGCGFFQPKKMRDLASSLTLKCMAVRLSVSQCAGQCTFHGCGKVSNGDVTRSFHQFRTRCASPCVVISKVEKINVTNFEPSGMQDRPNYNTCGASHTSTRASTHTHTSTLTHTHMRTHTHTLTQTRLHDTTHTDTREPHLLVGHGPQNDVCNTHKRQSADQWHGIGHGWDNPKWSHTQNA